MINTDLLTDVTISSAAVVPVIVSLVQVVKLTQLVKDQYAPVVSLAIGVLIAFLLIDNDVMSIGNIILTGILYGTSASGLYSGLLTTREAIRMNRIRNKENKRG